LYGDLYNTDVLMQLQRNRQEQNCCKIHQLRSDFNFCCKVASQVRSSQEYFNIDCIKAASQYQSKHNKNVRFLVEKYPRLVELIKGYTQLRKPKATVARNRKKSSELLVS